MLNFPSLRVQFPALRRHHGGQEPIFLDGPAGTQVPQRVIDAMIHYLTDCNANRGGVFATSQVSDRIIDSAHAAVADFLNAPS
jgi:selenocysteine lyase/cysteine desulfurase